MNVNELFPEMIEGQVPDHLGEWISIEKSETLLNFPLGSLSQREKALLELFINQGDTDIQSSSSWQQFLCHQKGSMPENSGDLQAVFIRHHEALPDELLVLIKELLPNTLDLFQLEEKMSVMILNLNLKEDYVARLTDIVPTLESDFGLSLSVFIGNAWYKMSTSQFRDCFSEERELFSAYIRHNASKKFVSFSEAMLWALVKNLSLPTIFNYCHQQLVQHSEFSDIVIKMWESQGNLVQTAQKLYIHRNSLQYKLDKILHTTGLNLKNLDDLTFAYLYLISK